MVQRYNYYQASEIGQAYMAAADEGEWVEHEDYAALEAERDELAKTNQELRGWLDGANAERDELAADYAQQVDKVNELATENAELRRQNEEMGARLRVIKESLNHENNGETTDDFRICRSALLDLVTALDGPVPECRECAEMRDEVEQLRVRDIEGGIDSAIAHLERTREVCGRILSRHAEGGSHE